MLSVKKISNIIACEVTRKLNLDRQQQDIIAYGAFGLFQVLWSILLVIIFSTIFKVTIEALTISFTISILRKYSGGVHSDSPGKCALIGTIISVGFAMIIFNLVKLIDVKYTILFSLAIMVMAYYLVYKLAPVDSPAKPIKNPNKRLSLKRRSVLILNIYSCIILMLYAIYISARNSRILAIPACVSFGALWQAFSLTALGHYTMKGIDAFFENIMKLFGGERNEK